MSQIRIVGLVTAGFLLIAAILRYTQQSETIFIIFLSFGVAGVFLQFFLRRRKHH